MKYQRLPESWLWQIPANTSANIFLGHKAEASESDSLSDDQPNQNSPEITLGLLVHEILHDISLKLPSDHKRYIQTSTRAWRTRLNTLSKLPSDEGLDIENWLNKVVQQVTRILKDPDGQWLLSSSHMECLSEAPFTGYYNGSLVNIVIDRTFLDDTGTRWIIDYKSSLKPDAINARDFVEQHAHWHTPQLRKYAELLSAWKPGPIKTALYFTDLPQLCVLESLP